MGVAGAARFQRHGLPTPLLAVLLASVAAMLVLSSTQLVHGGSAAGGRRSPPRLLLQGGPGEGVQLGEQAVSLHVQFAPQQQQQQQLEWQQEQAQPLDERQAALLRARIDAGDDGEGEDEEEAKEGAGGDDDDVETFDSSSSSSSSSSSEGGASSSGAAGADGDPSSSADAQAAIGGSDAAAAADSSAAQASSVEELTLPAGAGGVPDVAEQLTLEPGSDLATFADPGTHCVVTPSHSKVALLFLTHGDLPQDATWTPWMREAAGLLPRGSLEGPNAFCLKQCDADGTCAQQCGAAAACNPLCVGAVRRLGPRRSPAVLQQQHLFSVYVHARPTLKDYKEPSIFAGRLIPDRAIAKPGTHAAAAAAKRLLEAAVLDARNTWFVLIDDATVPLYHPTLFYSQLMSEARSRIDACHHKDRHLARQRSTPAMRTPVFDPARHWRKSAQWWMLNRAHAELVARDRDVLPVFGKHCFTGVDTEGRMRACPSDEHYAPSLLAAYGLDNETTCDATGGTHQRWVAGSGGEAGHWQVYQPGHVTPELIAGLRQAPGGPPDAHPSDESELCDAGAWQAAGAAARQAFFDAAAVTPAACPATLGSPQWLAADAYSEAALDPRCPLLGRGFSRHAARWVHRLYRSCTDNLGVLACNPKLTERDNYWFA